MSWFSRAALVTMGWRWDSGLSRASRKAQVTWLQLEGAAVAATGLEGVKEAAGIQPHAAQVGRAEAGQGRLGVGGIGDAVGADLAVAPGLPAQPFHGIVTVRPLGYVFAEPAPGGVTSPAVLDNRAT